MERNPSTSKLFGLMLIIQAGPGPHVEKTLATKLWQSLTKGLFMMSYHRMPEGSNPMTLAETNVPLDRVREVDVIAFHDGEDFRVLKNRFGPVDPATPSP